MTVPVFTVLDVLPPPPPSAPAITSLRGPLPQHQLLINGVNVLPWLQAEGGFISYDDSVNSRKRLTLQFVDKDGSFLVDVGQRVIYIDPDGEIVFSGTVETPSAEAIGDGGPIT